MNPDLNPIYIIMAVIVAVGGMVGGLINNVIDQPEESLFEKYIKDNVTQVDNEIQALKLAYNNSSVGYFRADCQNSQQYITEKWQTASRDSGMSAEDRKLNAEYKDFLVEASSIIDVYLARSNPDFTEYEKYRDNLLK